MSPRPQRKKRNSAVARLRLIGLACVVFTGVAAAADELYAYEDAAITFRLIPRTPEQIAAFYEARGLPMTAVRELVAACLMTAIIHNRGHDVVWLELDNWSFHDESGAAVQRLDRAYWTSRWERLAVPLAGRATFGWTQLPEQRDLQPDEPVGGNVGVKRVAGRFTLEARFHTGRDKRGRAIGVRIPGITCPLDTDAAREDNR